MDTKDYTREFDSYDINNNKGLAVLSYLGFLIIIPILCAKNSRFVKFHINQGLSVLFIELIIVILRSLLGWIPIIGLIIRIILWFVAIIPLAYSIIGIINAIQGKAKKLPLIGGLNVFKF